MKKTVGLVVMALMMLAESYSVSAQMKVSLDGRELAFDKEPKMINYRVMVPVRKILEELGAEVTYDKETSTATAIKDAHYAQFTNGSDYLLLGVCADGKNDGELSYSTSSKLDSAPVILNDTMYVPLRAVSEAFYYDVEWDEKTQTAKITTPKEADGWIYYSCWNDKGHMYKIDTNGQNRQMITDGDCYMENGRFEYNDGYIYYALRDGEDSKKDGKVYRVKTDGTDKKQISDKPIDFIYDYSTEKNNDALYFLEKSDNKKNNYYYNYSGYLKKLDLKTAEITDVYDEEIENVLRYKDYIYFCYNKEKMDEYTYYRMDANGENVIKVTGDIPAEYFSIEWENDRIRFSNALTDTSYTAALDGSDLQETGNDDSYDAIREKYNLEYFTTIPNNDRNSEQTELAVIGTKEDGYTYFIKENGDESFELKLPEGVQPYDVTVADDRLFYDVRKGKYEQGKLYVDSIDEIMGMKYISVGAEKVDGKYEITNSEYMIKYTPSEEDGIYCIKFDDGISRKIIDGYYIYNGRIEDNKLLIKKDDIIYTADLDGSNIQEYDTNRLKSEEDKEIDLNENAMYGIIVKNDGTVESYYNRIYNRP